MESSSTAQPNNVHPTMDTINSLTALLSNLTPTEASSLQPLIIHQISILFHPDILEANIPISSQITHLIVLLRLRAQFTRLSWPSAALNARLQETINSIHGSTPSYLTAILAKVSDLDSHLTAAINALLTQSAPEEPLAALQHYAALLSLLPHLTEQQMRGCSSSSSSPPSPPSNSLSSSSLSILTSHRKSILHQITRIISNPAVFDYLSEDPLSVLLPVTSIRKIIHENGWGEEEKEGGVNLDFLIGRHAMAVGYNFLAREEVKACGQWLSAEEREARIEERVRAMFGPLWGTVGGSRVASNEGDGVGPTEEEAGCAEAATAQNSVKTAATAPVPVPVEQQPLSPVSQEQKSPPLNTSTVPDSASPSPPTSTNPLASLFAERASRLEAQHQKRRLEEREASRAKAKAREEAIAADPTKAEQRRYAEEMKVQLLKEKEAKEVILKRIECDKIARKERAENERLRREQVGLGDGLDGVGEEDRKANSLDQMEGEKEDEVDDEIEE